jgi:hypothetical protein
MLGTHNYKGFYVRFIKDPLDFVHVGVSSRFVGSSTSNAGACKFCISI